MFKRERMAEPKPSESINKPLRGMRTEIEVLDKLLGYERSEIQGDYLKPKSILIIRGEPGAGKTTLALQILSKNIEKIKQNEKNKNSGSIPGKFIFFSLERKPEEVLKYTKERYGFFASEYTDPEEAHLQTLNANMMEQLIRSAINKPEKGLKGIIKECRKEFKPEIIENLMRGKWEASAVGSAVILAKVLASKLSNRKLEKSIAKLIQDSPYPFVLVDSLNVLVQLLQKITKDKDVSERLLLNAICDTMREIFKNSVIILTSEYHYQDVTKQSAVSESFFCDIEIALFSEPIVVPSNYEPKFESPLGSNMLSLMTPAINSIHTQSFCRVLKSRLTPNQARRCAYDIVPDKGIEFYETYPGDGHIALFAENARQHDVWQTFFDQDLPLLYPALRHNPFDRGSLQRTAAVQRRFRYIPQRVDLYLSSFDNYWINWYSELCLKSNIYSLLQQKLNNENFLDQEELLILLNEMCAVLTQGKAFASFQGDISPKIKKLFGIVYKSLSKLSKELWSKQAVEKLKQDDTIVDFMSFLSRVLTQSEQTVDIQENSVVKRSCLQCLWNRCLIRELHKGLSESNKKIIGEICNVILLEYQKLAMSLNNEPNSQNLEKRLDDVVNKVIDSLKDEKKEISPDEKNLIKVVKGMMAAYLKSRPALCKNLTIPIKVEAQPIEFFNFDATSCIWRNRLKSCTKEFISILFFREFLKQKKNISEDLRQKIAAIIYRNDNGQILQIEEINKELYSVLGENVAKRLLDLLKRNELVSLSNDICEKIEESVFDVFSASLIIKGQTENIRYLDHWLDTIQKVSNQPRDQLLVTLTSIFYEVAQSPARYRILAPVQGSKLRLFGERKSEIISELENHRLDSNRPIHHPVWLFSLRDQNTYCSIPYDANIGFLVFRKDFLNPFYKKLRNSRIAKAVYINTIIKLVKSQEVALKKRFPGIDKPLNIDRMLKKEVLKLVNNSISHKHPKTWEEIIAYYLLNQQKNKPESHFLIESKTLDTYLCTMLEFIWSCGADLNIAPDYSIESRDENLREVFRAFYLMALMFQNKIIPVNSTLDVEDFSLRYGREKKSKNSEQPDWTFARHWYSTLVDIVSAKKTFSKKSGEQVSDFIWKHDGVKLGVMQIPVSFSHYIKHKGTEQHISCWGDWHLAIISGTENMELGIDLINNLMNSDHVCERAFANAAVPTVEAFYEGYGDKRCFNLPERKDIDLPVWTYNDLRKNLFKHAKSRSEIYDYHHCMRELHAVLEYVHSAAPMAKSGSEKENLDKNIQEELSKKLHKAFETIEGFNAKPFMLT